jgi:hypothetical protein
MKKFIAVGFTVALLIVVALLSCQHFKHSRDAKIFKSLAGTWIMSLGSLTVHPDGSYVLQSTVSPSGGVVTNEGTFQVRDGFLIDTVTKTSQPNTEVPRVSRARIIRADDSEIVVNYEGARGETVFRKETT